MRDPQKRYEEMMAGFRKRGYRLTPQRVELLRLLASSEGHPSAAQLYERLKEQFPTTSLATVYKTLSTLKEMGEVLELSFSAYDNRYDGNEPRSHPHLICVRCRSVMDPALSTIRNMEREVADCSGYHIVGHRLDFYGICPDCAKEK